jgi:ribose transport system permease protein
MLPLGLLAAVGAGLLAGLANGLAVTWIGITSLVATLGMNAILLGAEQQITGGTINYTATANWDEFVSTKIAGVSILALLAAIAIVVVAVVMRRSVWGREFELVGANPRAARAAGLAVNRYQLGSYVAAGGCYALAGALLAGYLGRPQLGAGNEYLLPTIAVVVLGGTALGGGRGSVIATAGGVLFLAQLDQLLQVLGVTEAVQLIIQGVIVALGMGLRSAPWRALLHVGSRHRAGPGAGSNPRSAPIAEPGVPTGAPSS